MRAAVHQSLVKALTTTVSNIGVLNTSVAEVVKVEAHQRTFFLNVIDVHILILTARAFSVMPLVWCLG